MQQVRVSEIEKDCVISVDVKVSGKAFRSVSLYVEDSDDKYSDERLDGVDMPPILSSNEHQV